jgi:hypothetical protein
MRTATSPRVLKRKGAQSANNSAFSPDRFERAAVLGAVKAEPFGWPPRRPALTAPARGCLGTTAGRGGETGFRSNRETGPGQRRRGVHAIARLDRRFVLFVLDSAASGSSRRVVKCLEIVFGLIPGFSENDAFTIRRKERTMNQNWLIGNVEGLSWRAQNVSARGRYQTVGLASFRLSVHHRSCAGDRHCAKLVAADGSRRPHPRTIAIIPDCGGACHDAQDRGLSDRRGGSTWNSGAPARPSPRWSTRRSPAS